MTSSWFCQYIQNFWKTPPLKLFGCDPPTLQAFVISIISSLACVNRVPQAAILELINHSWNLMASTMAYRLLGRHEPCSRCLGADQLRGWLQQQCWFPQKHTLKYLYKISFHMKYKFCVLFLKLHEPDKCKWYHSYVTTLNFMFWGKCYLNFNLLNPRAYG